MTCFVLGGAMPRLIWSFTACSLGMRRAPPMVDFTAGTEAEPGPDEAEEEADARPAAAAAAAEPELSKEVEAGVGATVNGAL
jgi:hypothetical protein